MLKYYEKYCNFIEFYNNEKKIFFPLLLIILFLYTLYYNELSTSIFASPAVVRQEIPDPLNDWRLTNPNNNCNGIEKNIEFPEIVAVSYFSNGISLNATAWLSSYLNNLSSVLSLTLTMNIHIHSVYDEGDIDYQLSLNWDGNKKKWVKSLDEVSSANTMKRLEKNYNYVMEEGRNYVNFNLELNKISNPDEYSLFISETISLKKGHYTCYLVDPSFRVNIPPPPVTISESPNPLILRPNEVKIVEVTIKSPTLGFNPLIHLVATNDSSLQLKFQSNDIELPAAKLPASITSPLEVKVNENAPVRHYSIPISAYMSNPFVDYSSQIVQDIQNRTIFSPIKENYPLTIIVIEPLTFREHFENFWKAYGGIISFIGGGFAAGSASLLIDRLRKFRRINSKFEDY